MLQVVKRWYGDIAELRQKLTLVVVMRDNAGENKSKDIMEFFDSVGVRNHFSTLYEQWQNGLAEAAINSIMRLADGGLWARGEILVQGSLRREGCPQRHIQAAPGVNALYLYVR